MKVGKAEAESDATPVDQDEWMVSMEREGGGGGTEQQGKADQKTLKPANKKYSIWNL